MYEAFVAGIPSFLGESSGTAGRERVHEIPTSVERAWNVPSLFKIV